MLPLAALAQSPLPPCPASGNKHNCFGTAHYSTGGIYAGEFKDHQPNGQGMLSFPDGERYVGEFKNGERSGQGTTTFPDGRKYVGEFKNGQPNGRGSSTLANGGKYVGEFRNGLTNGQGILYHADGKINRSGLWINGRLTEYRAIDGSQFPFNASTQALISTITPVNPAPRDSIQPPASIAASTAPKVESIDDLNRQGENLDNEISRLKAELTRAREEQSAKERAEKIRASEEAARREAERIQSAIEESNRRKIDAEQKKPGNVLDVLFSKRWQIGDIPCDRKGGTYMFYDKELGFSSVIDGRTQGLPAKNQFQFIQQGYLEVVYRMEVTARENDKVRDLILSAGGSLSTLTARIEQHIRKINDNLLKVEGKNIGIDLENLLRNIISYSTRSNSHEFRACPASASALPPPSPPADSQISRSPTVASRSSTYYQPIFVCRDPYGAGRDETFAGILIQELVNGDDNVFVAMISNSTYSQFCHMPRTPNRLDESRFRNLSEFVGQREGRKYYLTRWQGMVMGTIEQSK